MPLQGTCLLRSWLGSAILFASLGSMYPAACVHAANTYESHDRIRALAERHAQAAVERIAPQQSIIRVEAARLDPRLNLPACSVEPETFGSTGGFSARSTVGIRCPQGAPWSLYVPVHIEILADVIVLATPLARGEAVRRDDLRVDRRNVAQLRGGYLSSIEAADGMVMRRPVSPGTVLTTTMLERPRLIQRGQRVRIRVAGSAFSIESEGEALANGAEGDHVRVRNLRSGLVVEGLVAADGTVVAGR